MELIDVFSYKSSSGSGISYFRMPDGGVDWTTGSANLGKYNIDLNLDCNSSLVEASSTPALQVMLPTVPISQIPSPTPPLISYENIYISEIMIYPESNKNEWIELYNKNDFPVQLVDWYIDDIEGGGSSPKKFSMSVPGSGYSIFEISTSIFNNDGDSVRLLDFDKNLKDDFEYKKSIQGKSLGRISYEDGNICDEEPTPGSLNDKCLSEEISTPTTFPTLTLAPMSVTGYGQPAYKKSILKNSSGNTVLGISTKIESPNKKFILPLTIICISFSLLTLVSVLIKMGFIYGKGREFFSSFVCSPGSK